MAETLADAHYGLGSAGLRASRHRHPLPLPSLRVTLSSAPLAGLAAAGPVVLERWFARHGAPPPLDLARSGAPALAVRDLLAMLPGEATLAALLDARLDYGDGTGSEALRGAIAASGAARRGDEVLVTHGAVEALLLTCAAVVGQRRRVLVGAPAYEALLRTPAAVGAEVSSVPVWRAASGWLDLSEIAARVDESVAAVLLNSPENPTGAVAAPADLDALAARCADAGAVLVVDEVALRTLDAAARPACASGAFGLGAVVSIGDVSKAFGLGGLRIGWLTTGSARLRAAAAAAKDLTTVANSATSELLATWALQRHEHIVGAVREMAQANLNTLLNWIATQPGPVSLTPPRDGLVAFPHLPHAAAAHTITRLRDDYGVALVPGSLFCAPDHVRVGLGVAPHRFAEALDRLDAALTSRAG
jgi:aspartate/methionine/tyrosine aminotransferase